MIPTAREQDMASKNDPGDSGGRVRPIDAPDLPSWLGRPKPGAEVDSEEDAPTQSGAHPLSLMLDVEPAAQEARAPAAPPAPSPHDPRELARKLAEEAKMRLAASQAARSGSSDTRGSDTRGSDTRGSVPVPQREPQERKEETPMAAEDPRELAKRLAEEAKKRLKEPAPASRPSSHSPPNSSFPPAAEEISATDRSVADRAAAERAGTGSRPMSALEALAAAREAEKLRARQAPPQPAPPAARVPSDGELTGERMAVERQARPEQVRPEQARPGQAPLTSVSAVVRKVFPRAEVAPATAVTNPEVFRALWRAHGARALHEGDVALVATSSVLQDAVGRISPGWLAAARMELDGAAWAVWVDLERGAVLAVARPAEIYLAGL
jgi:hypothetical protein